MNKSDVSVPTINSGMIALLSMLTYDCIEINVVVNITSMQCAHAKKKQMASLKSKFLIIFLLIFSLNRIKGGGEEKPNSDGEGDVRMRASKE